MRVGFLVSALVLAIFLTPAARAQVQLDVSKITCDQLVHSKIGPPRLVAAWLSGFFNGRGNNHMIEADAFQTNLSKLETFCYDEKNFRIPVMQAIEQALRKSQ